MIRVKLKASGLKKGLLKSITYTKSDCGKLVENLLRNIVTGDQAHGLGQSQGMHKEALQNKPSDGDIERDVKRLKSAFVLEGKQKRLKYLSSKLRDEVIKKRISRSGHTGRSLEYPNWMESVKSRIATISNDVTEKTIIQIQSVGLKPKATFKSRQGGITHFQKKIGLATNAIAETAVKAKEYVRKQITTDVRRFFK